MDVEQSNDCNRREVLQRELLASFKLTMDKLETFWNEIGITVEHVDERSKTVLKHVTYLFDDLVKEEEELVSTIRNQIKNHEISLKQLCLEMNEQFENPDDNLPLLQKEKFLRVQLDELAEKKKVRVDKYRDLRKKETRLCAILDMPQTQGSSLIPTDKDLYELEQHVIMLQDERERRYNKYCQAKKQLSTILEETDFTPETSFEREVICYDDDDGEDFVLSQEKLDQLKKVVERVQILRENMITEIKVLKKKVSDLWDRLGVDQVFRHEFSSKHSEVRHSTVIALKREIERCDEIRKENISQYINKLREELVDLWEKCYINELKRHDFEPFYREDYTEELLQEHEVEVDRLKKYYEDTKAIFTKIAQREELWKMMLVFERKATDPNRFTNRGGNLLQEERQRNKLLKDLPRLEEKILQEIEEYEELNDTLFLVNGVNFADYIKMQWEEHQAEKENEKLLRQKQRSEKLEPTTPRNKRQAFHTPASAPSKLGRSMGLSKMPKLSMTPKTPSNNTTAQSWKKCMTAVRKRSPRFAGNRNVSKAVNILKERNANEVKTPLSNGNNTTSYTDFAAELNKESRERCRSSVVAKLRPHKVYGSKVSHNGSLRRNKHSFNSSASRSRNSSKTLLKSNKSLKNTSRTPTKIQPARGVLGLPFLI